MKIKKLSLILAATLILSSCGNQPTGESIHIDDSLYSSEVESEENITNEAKDNTDKNGSDVAVKTDSVEVDQNNTMVTLNIPKDFVGDSTQEDLDQICEDNDFQSITLNDDGSATYIMTQEQHDKLIEEYRQQINNDLSNMIGSENYPNFTKIEANADFTEYTITTISKELELNEAFSTFQFYIYSGMYNVFAGKEESNICVTFKNAETGEIIHTENSSESK